MEGTDGIRLGTDAPIVDSCHDAGVNAGLDVWPVDPEGESGNGYGAQGDSEVAGEHGDSDDDVRQGVGRGVYAGWDGRDLPPGDWAVDLRDRPGVVRSRAGEPEARLATVD